MNLKFLISLISISCNVLIEASETTLVDLKANYSTNDQKTTKTQETGSSESVTHTTTSWIPYNYSLCSYGYYVNAKKCLDCGETIVEPNVRIVGGIQALKSSWPSHVLLAMYETVTNFDSPQLYSICGGTLINKQTVLTASHCLVKKDVLIYVVYMGIHNISSILHKKTIQTDITHEIIENKNIIMHPLYDPYYVLNDIGLILLKNPIETTIDINIACLPESSKSVPSYDDVVYGIGWGALKEGDHLSDLPDILYNVNLTTYSPDYCKNVSGVKKWDSQICAGAYYGGKDTCQGDSGSGLYSRKVINGKVKSVVVGIVSYGDGCARPYLPGIYTRTSYYIEWIVNNWIVPAASTGKCRVIKL